MCAGCHYVHATDQMSLSRWLKVAEFSAMVRSDDVIYVLALNAAFHTELVQGY